MLNILLISIAINIVLEMFVNINFFNSYSPLGRPATYRHHTNTPIATHIDHQNRRPAASSPLL